MAEDDDEQEDDVSVRECNSCGAEIGEDDIICPNCGDVLPEFDSEEKIDETGMMFGGDEADDEEMKGQVPEGLKMVLGSAGDMIERKVLSTVKEREEKLSRYMERNIRENERKFMEKIQQTAQQLKERQDEDRERLNSRVDELKEEKKKLESELDEEIKKIEKKIEDKEEALDELEDEQQKARENLREELKEKDKELGDKQKDIREKNEELRSQIEEDRQKQINARKNLKDTLEEKHEKLRDRLLEERDRLDEKLEEKKKELEGKIDEQDGELSELENRIQEQKEEFMETREEIRTELRDELIQEHKKDITDLREEMIERYEEQMNVLTSMMEESGGTSTEKGVPHVGGIDLEEKLSQTVFPFTAIVGQERMKRSLLLNAINPEIKGVLIWGPGGTAKKTAILGVAELLSEIEGLDKEEVKVWNDPDRYMSGTLVTSEGNADYLIDNELNTGCLSTRLVGSSKKKRSPTLLVEEPGPMDRRLISNMDDFSLYVKVEPLKDMDRRMEISRRSKEFKEDPEEFRENHDEEIESLRDRVIQTRQRLPSVRLGSRQRSTISKVCAQNDLPSDMDIVIEEVSRTIAAYDEREEAMDEDIQEALDLTLIHRVTEELVEEV